MGSTFRFSRVVIVAITVILCACLQLAAGDVSLAWDPSTSEGVVGYKVYYGSTSGSYDSFRTVTGQSSYTITDLSEGTYYFAVTAFDTSGNESGYSNEVSTVVKGTEETNPALPAPDPVVEIPGDGTPPGISNIAATAIEPSGARISWTTNEASNSQVRYGTTASYGLSTPADSAMTLAHALTLAGLAPGTVYHYQVLSTDAAGNRAESTDRTFTTPLPPDTGKPEISSVESAEITPTGARIRWTTNEASDSQVEYGTTSDCGASTALDPAMRTSHAQTLDGLSADTQYYYRVRSRDAAGNLATSNTLSFKTAADSTPPVITAVAVSGQTGTEATITWTTDKASDTQIEYGPSPTYGASTGIHSAMVLSHEQVLAGLVPGTTYHYRVLSSDARGNQAVSADYAFTAMNVAATRTMPLFHSGLMVQNDELYVGLAVMNDGEEAATIAFTAFDEKGNMIAGGGLTNPAVRQLAPYQQLSLVDVEIFGDSLAKYSSDGWIRLESTTENVRGFLLTFDGKLKLMDGVRFAPDPLKQFIFTHIETAGSTGTSFINRYPQAAEVTIDLLQSDGRIRYSTSRVIGGNAALTDDVFTDLFDGCIPDSTDYIRVSSESGVDPFQVVQQGSADISFLTGWDVSTASGSLYLPKYVYSRSYRTDVTVVNTSSRSGNVRVRLMGNDGTQIGATRILFMEANGKLFIAGPEFFLDSIWMDAPGGDSEPFTPGKAKGQLAPVAKSTPTATVDGYIEVVSDQLKLVGSTSYRGRNSQSFIATLPLVNELQDRVVFEHVISDDLYYTELAIANPGTAGAAVILDLFNAQGKFVDTATVAVRAGGQTNCTLEEVFKSLQGSSQTGGYVILSSDTPVAALSLFGTRNGTVLSAMPVR